MKKGKKIKKPENQQQLTEFASSILRKQFRFSDWFAEQIIRFIAFMSITIVALIFIFVFRETIPVFKSNDLPESLVETSGSTEAMRPEVYDPEADETAMKPETYGIDVEELPTLTSEEDSFSLQEPAVGETKKKKAVSTLLTKDWLPVSD